MELKKIRKLIYNGKIVSESIEEDTNKILADLDKEELIKIISIMDKEDANIPEKKQVEKKVMGSASLSEKEYDDINDLLEDSDMKIADAYRTVTGKEITTSFYYGWNKWKAIHEKKSDSKPKKWKTQKAAGENLGLGVIQPNKA